MSTIKQNGLYDRIIYPIMSSEIELFEPGGVEPNPGVATAKAGIDICKREKIGFVLAAGWGSTIDRAKTIAAGSKYDGGVWNSYEKRINNS